MKKFLSILLLFSVCKLSAQQPLWGEYERRDVISTVLLLFTDGSFTEKITDVSCGYLAGILGDTAMKGHWMASNQVLTLEYSNRKYMDSVYTVTYYIDTVFDCVFFRADSDTTNWNYIKTKGFTGYGNGNWELNPNRLMTFFDATVLDEKAGRRNKLIRVLEYCLRGSVLRNQVKGRYEPGLSNIFYASPFGIYEQAYFIGRFQYGLNNPMDTKQRNYIKAGLKKVIELYQSKLRLRYNNKYLERLVREAAKDDLEQFMDKHATQKRPFKTL